MHLIRFRCWRLAGSASEKPCAQSASPGAESRKLACETSVIERPSFHLQEMSSRPRLPDVQAPERLSNHRISLIHVGSRYKQEDGDNNSSADSLKHDRVLSRLTVAPTLTPALSQRDRELVLTKAPSV